MNVTKKQIDDLNLELTLQIAAEDYAPAEKKKFAELQRTAEFKGFRKGKVPASLIQRVYGEQVLVEAVNQKISEGIDGYISDNNLRLMGEPLGSENQPELEWKSGNDFTFIFDLALAPEVDVKVEKSDELPSYSVTISAKDKAPMIENMKKYYEENKSEEGVEPKSDEEIEKEVTERMKEQYKQQADWRLEKDIRDYFVKKSGIQLPEAFLKRWIAHINKDKFTPEQIEKEFPKVVEDTKWELVCNKLMQQYEINVEQKDITDAAEAYVRYQYAMYGLANLPAEMLTEAMNNVLADRSQVERLVDQVQNSKVMARIKEDITLKSTKISVTKFQEL